MSASISTILIFPCTTWAQPGCIELPDSLVLRRGVTTPIMTFRGPTERTLELIPSTGQINSLDFTSSKTVNGVTTVEKGTRYYWSICDPSLHMATVSACMFLGTDTVGCDTFTYRIIPTLLRAFWTRKGTRSDIVYSPDQIELQAITGIRIWGAESPTGGEKPILQRFTLSYTGANGKTKIRTNKGPTFSRSNKRRFRRSNTGTIHVRDVVALSPCGYRFIVAEPPQIVR